MKAKFLFAFLSTTLFTSAAYAGLPEGILAYDTQQYQKAFEVFNGRRQSDGDFLLGQNV